MSSWPAHLLSNAPTSSSSSTPPFNSAPHSSNTDNNPRQQTQPSMFSNSGTSNSRPTPNVPTVTGPAAPEPSRRLHSRSNSHPFPSLFGGSKKDNNNNSKAAARFDALESTDDEVTNYVGRPQAGSPSKSPHHRRGTPSGDLLTGKCMTCDSTVRWPRNLKVFRCSVCLTINDLEPNLESSKDVSSSKSKGYSGQQVHRKPLPISIERTRSIIDRCVFSYLQSQLEKPESSPSPPRHPDPNHVTPEGHRRSRSQLPFRPANIGMTRDIGPPAPSDMGPDSHHDHRLGLDGSAAEDLEKTAQSSRKPESMFRPLENYIISSFRRTDCLNNSFTTTRSHRAASEGHQQRTNLDAGPASTPLSHCPTSELDPKTLLLGDIAENGSWWTGNRGRGNRSTDEQNPGRNTTGAKAPRINWTELEEWYQLIIHAGESWFDKWTEMRPDDSQSWERSYSSRRWETTNRPILDQEIFNSRQNLLRTLLKATENLLKRPRRPLKQPDDIRFLLILLANPLLYSSSLEGRRLHPASSAPTSDKRPMGSKPTDKTAPSNHRRSPSGQRESASVQRKSSSPGRHSGIIKRILGLLSNLPNDCHQLLVSWFSRLPEDHFQRTVDLIGRFVTYRLTRQHGRQRNEPSKPGNSLVPNFSSTGGTSSAQLHAELTARESPRPADNKKKNSVVYDEDWQIKAAARVMSLLFAANDTNLSKKRGGIQYEQRVPSATLSAKHHAYNHGQIIPINSFYNTLLDYSDLLADFESWESRRGKFSFCQYPFFLSIWAKIHILEHDARRQMEVKAREAFFDSILSRKAISQYLVLKVRRDCLAEDSLRGVSEVVGSGQEDIKKGLRIEFVGEEGVDAGGLRKEWFLLLVREVFDPHHGLFIYDDDSQYCYFNPYCFESSEQFFLVGVLLGLAIYNSTILDVPLPPFAFKKLLASAPPGGVHTSSTPRLPFVYTLEDLAEYRPALAKGLRSLLEYDGDVEDVFCRDFVVEMDRYGQNIEVPLCSNGKQRPVTNRNRREFVDLYVRYLLDTAVSRQFEPFKRGFFTVCGGNALSLFRPEEIELLVRGSDEPLDINSLRAVATYEHWSCPEPEKEPVVVWFWEFFSCVSPQHQRKILSFITGSDRIPAMGATNLIIRLVCLGSDTSRFPTARTCFNMVALYRYSTKEEFQEKFWRAVIDSEGFGLK